MTSKNTSPWLWPYGEHASWVDSRATSEGHVSRLLNQRAGNAEEGELEFIHSAETLGALEYERRVYAGQIPTRDIAHDWYNGQVWLTYPKAKRFINTCHVTDSPGNKSMTANGRSRLRDALTLFDESGALLLTTDPRLCVALVNHQWEHLLVNNRDTWGERAKLLIFGHGLLDSMQRPHKSLCAKVLPVLVPNLNMSKAELQCILLAALRQLVDPVNLSPLPVMGVPGWFVESNRPGFYSDKSVYRAKPTRRPASLHERLVFVWDGTTLVSGKCAGQSLPEFQGEESPDSSEHGAG